VTEPKVSAPEPAGVLGAALEAALRGAARTRRGGIVVLAEASGALLVLAAEHARPESLARLRALSGGAPSLVLSGRRAQVLGLTGALGLTEAPGGVVHVALAGGVTAEMVRRMADPAAAKDEKLPAPIKVERPERDSLPALAALLVKLARLLPSAVVARVPAARLAYLAAWASAERLLTVEREDVEAYRRPQARELRQVAEAEVPLAGARNTRIVAFQPEDGGKEHLAIVIGQLRPQEPVLVRLHSECFTGDLLGSLRCDCGDQLRLAIAAMHEAGGGVLLYLAQEGRGIGLVNKLRAYALQDAGADTYAANEQLGFDDDERVFTPAAVMLGKLGIARVRLMTNNPAKVKALQEAGIEVVERVPLLAPTNPHNTQYLATKRDKSGHLF
jgi:GTP cyclohydrolase II